MSKPDLDFIAQLEVIVQDRLSKPSGTSYTTKLVAAGPKRIAQKVGEEGVELALAALLGDAEEVTDEAADLVYHLIVLLADQGLSLGDISKRLEVRHASRSGNA